MRKKALAAVVAMSVAVAIAGCSAGDTTGPDGMKEITIGLLAPLTGDSAADGQGMKAGLTLAVNELNAQGGVAGYTFKISEVDTQNLQSDAVAAGVQTLISDPNVKAVLTSYASANNFEIETFAQAEMPYMVNANGAQTEEIISKNPDAYPTVWSFVPSYKPFSTDLPVVLEKWNDEGKIKLRDKSAFVITSDNPFSQDISKGLIATLTERGWDVKGEETVPYGSINDWGAILSKIRAVNPDLIIDTDYLPANEATFLAQFVDNPTNSILFMQYGPSIPEFLELTKETSTGVLYNNLGDPIHSEKYAPAQELFQHIRDLNGGEIINDQGIVVYEEMMLYADALKSVGDPDKKLEIGAYIGSSSTVTAMGTLKFDPKTHLAVYGDDLIPLQFLQIRNGERVTLLPGNIATGEFVAPPWYTK